MAAVPLGIARTAIESQHVSLHASNYEICSRIMLGVPPDRLIL